MKEGKVPVNLSIPVPIATAVKAYVAANPRKGRRNVSELTEALWISYLRSKGWKLPPLLKVAVASKPKRREAVAA